MKIRKKQIIADVGGEAMVIHFAAPYLRDPSDVQRIVAEIEQVVATHQPRHLVINFGRLRQVTSSFLGALLTLRRMLKERGIRMRVCRLRPEVERAYRVCKLQKLIPIFPDEAKALEG
jgi:anti-anti-sigma factor